MKPSDIVWNRATVAADPGARAELEAGDRALAALLLVHGSVMNGGVLHAVEALDREELARGADGYRYFSLDRAAALIERAAVETPLLPDMPPQHAEDLEVSLDAEYFELIPDDSAIVDAFERMLAERPAAFAPPHQAVAERKSPVEGPATVTLKFDIHPRTSVLEFREGWSGDWVVARHGDHLEVAAGVYSVRVDGKDHAGWGLERGMSATVVVRAGISELRTIRLVRQHLDHPT
jgi:hypothetical protein